MSVTTTIIKPGKNNPSRVTVDWSQEKEININHLVEWLKGYPRKGDIHVYIPRRFNHSPTASFRTTLQALGCTVTSKIACRA
ncbi:MAG: hypothetical protein QF741_03425 [Candidatus Peribacteraceae bacterium]|jgi:hypothetical protein|nr:hypothetical protein [Candidatus Peribacteraceae bacterium]|tara:strand:- start:156 stop:401 length:246 start_codon:yes stop_codon:yes gene_type:complete